MILKNKLNLTNQLELQLAEERISKQKARELYDSGELDKMEVGTYVSLAYIHQYLFAEIYDFAGKLREVNIAKGNFRFAPVMFLKQSLDYIGSMKDDNFAQIIEKYVEMNVAHPFREGNGRATRIWLDQLLKRRLQKVVDWQLIEKEKYLSAMERSVVNDLEIKSLIQNALTDKINDRLIYMTNIDISYFYEGYSHFKTKDLP